MPGVIASAGGGRIHLKRRGGASTVGKRGKIRISEACDQRGCVLKAGGGRKSKKGRDLGPGRFKLTFSNKSIAVRGGKKRVGRIGQQGRGERGASNRRRD